MNALQPKIVIGKTVFLPQHFPAAGTSQMISKTVPEKYQQPSEQPIGGEA